ncbi:MAG: ATP-binding protein [Endomicrobiales bacterium]
MRMKVQARLILLISLFMAASIGGLLLLRSVEMFRAEKVYRGVQEEKNVFVDKIRDLKKASLDTFVADYTFWDDMVRFLATGDRVWAAENINTGMATFNTNAVWVYRSDFSLVYSTDNISGMFQKVPVDEAALRALFVKERFCHFFVVIPGGLMEIRGASLHPIADSDRQTPPRGYFLVGRQWTEDYIGELSRLTSAKIDILPAASSPGTTAVSPAERRAGVILLSRMLTGWDNAPLMRMDIRIDSGIVREINAASRQQFVYLSLFGLLILGLFSVSILFLVSRPLGLISQSLDTANPGPMQKLKNDTTEFGHIAQMILEFFGQKEELFSQKEKLIEEVEEREQAERSLQEAQRELERRVDERTVELRTANEALKAEIVEREKAESQREQLRAQLIASEKLAALGRMASSLAHEISSPLGSILLYAQLMLEGLTEESTFYPQLKNIERAAERSKTFIQSLLALSRKGKVEKEACDFNEVVKGVLHLAEARAKTAGVTVDRELGSDIPPVNANKAQIQQMVLNLCNNAVDAMGKGGKLTVRSRPGRGSGGSFVEMQVQDTGAGISEEVRAKIFEPFFTTKGEGKGTGLGLTLVREIVERHGGVIDFESGAGVGTIFTVRLPAQ